MPTETRAESDVDRRGGRVIRWPRAYDLIVKTMSLGREGRLRRQLVGLSGVGPGDAVLDVGSGTGTLLRAVRREVPGVGRLCGVEPAREMIAHARRLGGQREPALEIEQGHADHLPHPDASFDVVFCTFVVHHLPPATTAAAFREMRRVLRPGGRVVVADFRRRRGGHPLGTRVHDAVGRLMHPHARSKTVSSVEASALEAAGFEDVRVEGVVMRAVGVWIGAAREAQ